MKKISFFLLGAMLFGVFSVYAGNEEDEDDRRRRRRRRGPSVEVGINPLGYIWGNYNLMAGLHFSDEASLFLEIAYNRNKFPYSSIDSNGFPIATDVVFNGFSMSPEFRYYFAPDDGNDKWFVGGYLKFRVSSTSGTPYTGIDENEDFVPYDLSNVALAPGLTFGYEWVTRSGLTITLWSGMGYALIYTERKSPDFIPSTDPFYNTYNFALDTFNKLDFRGGFTLGYRF